MSDQVITAAVPGAIDTLDGYVDRYGYSTIAGGWIAVGWIGHAWDDRGAPFEAKLDFAEGMLAGKATTSNFPRSDVQKVGSGLILFVESADSTRSHLTDVFLELDGRAFRLRSAPSVEQVAEGPLLALSRELIASSPRSERRSRLLRLVNRPQYAGADTLGQFPYPVFLELDATHFCPPAGLLLRGWFADPFEQVTTIKIRSAGSSQTLDQNSWIWIPRPDVAEPLRQKHGFMGDRCGFIAFVPGIYNPREIAYFEVETSLGDVGHKRIPVPQSTGLAAIRDLLQTFEIRYQELKDGYDKVIGPAVKAMNEFRLAKKPRVRVQEFGTRTGAVRASIIIPLYGRMDFLEYQLAFFSRTLAPDHELIYVLDDPKKLAEVQALAASCLARFRRSFKLVVPSHNLGYGPANNIGLRYARGSHICFLNSDVFPQDPDWLEHLLETAQSSRTIGITGALMLFEDGTVQHDGVSYKQLPELAGWTFSIHPHKGRYPEPGPDTIEVEAVTGACMLMPSSLALELGGFDEGFVVGDFEDVDLCRRVQQRGLTCVVDRRARLYHLERQSQGDQEQIWRTNLTLYNAWRFDQKWSSAHE